jgi:hypothetical protein
MKKKTVAFILCALLCLAVASSLIFIAEASGHDCPGDDCHICLELKASLSLLSSFALVILAAFFLDAAGGRRHILKSRPCPGPRNTLVLLKVKLTV